MTKAISLLIVMVLLAAQSLAADKNYTINVLQIKNTVKSNSSQYHHSAYNRLAYWVDTYGPRLWGSNNLELAITDLYTYAVSSGLDNVAMEPVNNFTAWWRGQEKLTLYEPRYFPQDLKISGLGTSVPGNVTGQVIVVRNWTELD